MKTTKSFLTEIAILAVLLAACRSAAPVAPTQTATEFFDPLNPPTATPTETLVPITPSAKIAQANVARDTHPSVPTEDLQALVQGNNAFAFDMYQSMREEDGNMVFSPYSISLALAMAYAGARGETEAQMADVLHFDLPQEKLHPAFNKLSLELDEVNDSAGTEETQEVQLEVTNSLWAQDSYSFRQEYLDTIALNYGTGIRLVDFINNYNPLLLEINSWVREQTKGKINGLLPEGALDDQTRMVLVNAVYFKADWLYNFIEHHDTWNEPFYLLDGTIVETPLMKRIMWGVSYAKGTGWQAIELPYYGFTTSMIIIVPDKENFTSFEDGFDVSVYNNILRFMKSRDVYLGLPKFKFGKNLSLVSQLSKMGITDAFEIGNADFSGMAETDELGIGNILHETHISVDEEGTEAVAATSVLMREVSGEPDLDIELIIDRPFIFVIRDTVNGQILFIGRVLNPLE